jgi:hypothetical protein
MEFVRSYDSIHFGLPSNQGESVPPSLFSGPAQRALTLRPARSPGRLATLCTRGFSSFVACCSDCYRVERTSSRAGLLPPWTTAFHGATDNRQSDGMSSACRLLATQRSMKTGSSLLSFAATCGPEVVSLTGALEPVHEFDPGRTSAQRTVASS